MQIDRRFERAVIADDKSRERQEKQQIFTEFNSIVRRLDIDTARNILAYARDKGNKSWCLTKNKPPQGSICPSLRSLKRWKPVDCRNMTTPRLDGMSGVRVILRYLPAAFPVTWRFTTELKIHIWTYKRAFGPYLAPFVISLYSRALCSSIALLTALAGSICLSLPLICVLSHQ